MTGLHVANGRTASGWWEMVSRPPVESLRGLVRRYTGYREDATAAVRRREVPTGSVSLILSFGPRIRVVAPSLIELGSFVAPIGTTWAITEYTGTQYGLEIRMSPLGATALLGVPMDSLAGTEVELSDVLGREADLLIERLAETAGWAARFDLLDVVLPARTARGRTPSPVAAYAWRRLRETNGRVPIGTLVDELGCSHRYLLNQFRAHVGVGPKQLAVILRCQQAMRLLERRDGQHVADIAMRCGYCDEAHLDRDFRQLVGVTPGQWHTEFRLDAPELAEH